MEDVLYLLAQAQEKRAEREDRRLQEKAASELEMLRLEDRLEDELGPRGVQFEIVDCRDVGGGFVAVKLGPSIVHTRFANSKQTSSDLDSYVTPCLVHPTVEAYRALVFERPALVGRCALALAYLYGVQREGDQKK